MPNGARKGSAFERAICKKLSLWWTNGKDDAVFWRSSQSGGRATTRAKQGKKTFGSYGDIAAVNPIGAPLLEAFTIELKRGKSGGFPGDIIDREKLSKKHPWVQTIIQTRTAKKQAGSKSWLIIAKRDGRQIMVYQPMHIPEFIPFGSTQHGVEIKMHGMKLQGMSLDRWLEGMSPETIKAFLYD